MSEEEILDIIRTRVGIVITRFDSCYIRVALTLDGAEFDADTADVPTDEIRESVA